MRRRLWDSPEGRKRTVGGSLLVFRKDARKAFCQRAQISGEVTMKGRKGFPLRSLVRRGERVRRMPGVMVMS